MGNDEHHASESKREQHASSGKTRHNVYIAWLTPRTKICEADEYSVKSEQNRAAANSNQSSGEKKEISFDRLELGDHVEIQFSPQEESGANRNVHQSQQMRQTHGRDRTFVGYATSIMVLPEKDHNKSGSAANANEHERTR